jgi:hypothetical protein
MANSVAHRPVRPTIFLGPAKATSMDITREESAAFWSWATVEVLRHTGIRIEEMLELTHHSFVAYTLPTTGEVVPMLQVAPSKTDAEPLVRTKMPVSDAHYFGLTQLKCPDWRRSAPTSSPDCRRPRTRAGSAKSPRSKPQWPQQRRNSRRCRRWPLNTQPPTWDAQFRSRGWQVEFQRLIPKGHPHMPM